MFGGFLVVAHTFWSIEYFWLKVSMNIFWFGWLFPFHDNAATILSRGVHSQILQNHRNAAQSTLLGFWYCCGINYILREICMCVCLYHACWVKYDIEMLRILCVCVVASVFLGLDPEGGFHEWHCLLLLSYYANMFGKNVYFRGKSLCP